MTTWCIALTEVAHKLKQQLNFKIPKDAQKRKETNQTEKANTKTKPLSVRNDPFFENLRSG